MKGAVFMKKGQSGLEFIVLLGFLLIVFLSFTVVIQEKIREQEMANQRSLSVQLADMIEQELLLAARVAPGYSRAFLLPRVLGKQPYNVTLENGDTLVITKNGEEYLRFLSVNVTLKKEEGASDNRIALLPESPMVYVQKNEYGRIFFRRDCVKEGKRLEQCAIDESE